MTARRQYKVGRVVSNKMEKSVVVAVDYLKPHPLYRKIIRNQHTRRLQNMARVRSTSTCQTLDSRILMCSSGVRRSLFASFASVENQAVKVRGAAAMGWCVVTSFSRPSRSLSLDRAEYTHHGE